MPEMLHIVALFKLQDILLFTVASPTFDVMPDLRNLLRRIVIKVYNAPKPGFHYSPVRNISKEIAGDIIAAMKLIFRAVNGSPSPIFKPNLLDSFQEIVLMMDCLICNPQTSNDREDYNIQEQLWNLDTLVEESEAKLKRAA